MIYTYIRKDTGGISMIAVRLQEDQEIRLDRLADMTGRTKTYYVREAIEKHLDELELIYLAEQRVSNVRAGKSKTTSWEEIKRENGLQD
jgi:RHH-type transcriptional regulator, rel operon repressor / antitoxin RelB